MLTAKIKKEIKEHALSVLPEECCGVIIAVKGKPKYTPCGNVHPFPTNSFIISPDDFVVAEDKGEVIAIVHSHPATSELPSSSDKASQSEDDIPWIIYSVVNDAFHEFTSTEVMPLYGREYHHGTIDCLSFVRDFYKQEFGISITNYYREDEWWHKGQNLYMELYEQEGFYEVPFTDMQYGDLLLMTIGCNVANHGAIYIGGNKVGHHLTNRISSVDIYGNFLRDRTVKVLRHKDVKKD